MAPLDSIVEWFKRFHDKLWLLSPNAGGADHMARLAIKKCAFTFVLAVLAA